MSRLRRRANAARLVALASAAISAAVLISYALGSPASAQAPAPTVPGGLDTTFGTGGFATVPIGSGVGGVATVIQPDGKIVTAGEANLAGTDTLVATRMNSDGSMDVGFGDNGVVEIARTGDAGMDSGAGLTLQSDGKIVIAGTATDPNSGALAFAAVRLLPTGALDPSFGSGGVATVPIGTQAIATAVAIQPDGKIVLGGVATAGHNEFAAARLNPDGSLDAGFGLNGVTTLSSPGVVWGMALQGDGDIVLAGETDTANDKGFMVARLLPNGALDRSFNNQGILQPTIGAWSIATAVALQPDGRIVVAGSTFTNTPLGAAIRLLPDGSLDPSFGTAGVATFPDYSVNAIALDSSGRIVLAGVGIAVGRLERDGSVDRSFGDEGIAHAVLGTNDAANDVAIDPQSGSIVLACEITISGRAVLAVTRLTGDPPAAPVSPTAPVAQPTTTTSAAPIAPAPAGTAGRSHTTHRRATAHHKRHKRKHHARRGRGKGAARLGY